MELPIVSNSIYEFHKGKLSNVRNNKKNNFQITKDSYYSTKFPSTTDSFFDNTNTESTFNTKNTKKSIHNVKKSKFSIKQGEISYYTNKMKMAEILNQTKSVLDNSLEHDSQLEKIKSKAKSKYLTDLKSINMLQEFEYIKKWKLDENKNSANNSMVKEQNSTYMSNKNKIPDITLIKQKYLNQDSHISPKNIFKADRINNPAVDLELENTNKSEIKSEISKTEFTYEGLDCVESEIYHQFDKEKRNEKMNKKFSYNSHYRKISSQAFNLRYELHPKSQKKQKFSNLQIESEKSIENEFLDKTNEKFLNFHQALKENINSYIEYAANAGSGPEDFDYITNVDKGLSMKNEIKNMGSGYLPPGSFLKFNSITKKIQILHPRFIKTKFKKPIILNEHAKLFFAKIKKDKLKSNMIRLKVK